MFEWRGRKGNETYFMYMPESNVAAVELGPTVCKHI